MPTKTFIAAVAATIALTGSVSAATCADRTALVDRLEKRFDETLYANSVSRTNEVLEVFASPNQETWSILVFLPKRGLSCLAATGKGRRNLELALSGR